MSCSTTPRSKKSKSRKWDLMDIPSIEEIMIQSEEDRLNSKLPAGYCVRFFSHDMQKLYSVASHYVFVTRGVIDHLQDYNQLGPNKSRNKLFICAEYDRDKKCRNGSFCRELHCILALKDAQEAKVYSVPSNATGSPSLSLSVPIAEIEESRLKAGSGNTQPNQPAIDLNAVDDDSSPLDSLVPISGNNEVSNTILLPEGLILTHPLHSRWTTRDMYPTLKSGVTFNVALPNTAVPVDDFDSGTIFVTKGAEEYYNQVVSNETTTVTMQYCAHFSKNGVCCYGDECQFVHVVHYQYKTKQELDVSESDTDANSLGSSIVVDKRKTTKNKHSKETPLSTVSTKQQKKAESSMHSRSSSQSSNLNASSTNAAPPGTVFVPPGWQPGANGAVPFPSNGPSFPAQPMQQFVMMSNGTPQMFFMPQQTAQQQPMYFVPFGYPNQQ